MGCDIWHDLLSAKSEAVKNRDTVSEDSVMDLIVLSMKSFVFYLSTLTVSPERETCILIFSGEVYLPSSKLFSLSCRKEKV